MIYKGNTGEEAAKEDMVEGCDLRSEMRTWGRKQTRQEWLENYSVLGPPSTMMPERMKEGGRERDMNYTHFFYL